MKLVDCEPSFFSSGGEGISDKDGNPVPSREGVGLASQRCPCGDPEHRGFAIMFENPLDGGPRVEGHHAYWTRTGETFDVLTLTPSIQRNDPPCRWHGYLTNGEFVNA